MKKILYIALVSAASILAASCTKEELKVDRIQSEPASPCLVSFTVSVDGGTKASLDGLHIAFAPGDSIEVFWKGGGSRLYTSEGGTNATFTGDLNMYANDGTEKHKDYKPYDGEQIYGHYPSVDVDSDINFSYDSSNDVLKYSLPSTQKPVKGSFDPNCSLMFAKFGETSAVFKHLTSFVKMTITESDVRSAIMSSNGAEKISGGVNDDVRFIASLNSDGTPLGFTGGDKNSIIIVPADGDKFEPGDYYINVVPGTMESGITLDMSRDNMVSGQKTSSNPVTFRRSSIMNLGTVDSGLEWIVPVAYTTVFAKEGRHTFSYPSGALPGSGKVSFDSSIKDENYSDANITYGLHWEYNSSSGNISLADAGLYFKYPKAGSYIALPTLEGKKIKAVVLKLGSGTTSSSSIALSELGNYHDSDPKINSNSGLGVDLELVPTTVKPDAQYMIYCRNAKNKIYFDTITTYYIPK